MKVKCLFYAPFIPRFVLTLHEYLLHTRGMPTRIMTVVLTQVIFNRLTDTTAMTIRATNLTDVRLMRTKEKTRKFRLSDFRV